MKRLLFRVLGIYRKIIQLGMKIRGKTPNDVHEKRIITGQAWNDYCNALKAAGAAAIHGKAPKDAFNQAEAYRYLARLARTSLEAFVEFGDPEFPQLRRMVHETVKIGADNPDNYYQNTVISGEFDYKISGIRNSISFLSFHVMNGQYGSDEGVSMLSELYADQLIIDENKRFEIYLSKEPKGMHWMKIDKDSSLLIVRQTFLDRKNEQVADLNIECLNGRSTPGKLSAQYMDQALGKASMFVAGTPMFFSTWANRFQKHTNQLPEMDEKTNRNAGGDQNLVYYHSHYELEEGKCLVIHSKIPECLYWNFQLNNYWMESLDYRYHKIHINKHTAKYNEDGSVTVVVAKEKVDHPNYLTTDGHNRGTMLWRWMLPSEKITPNCKVMEITDFESNDAS